MPAVSVENLWKQYRYGRLGYGTLRHDLQSWWAGVRGRPDPNAKLSATTPAGSQAAAGDRFWALERVSFEVAPGEAVGIIGKNGAGKSTLLKILSRVTSPTRGAVHLRGRLASLLEVGTGFHPDLTGRENVFLNGAILGMTRAEVRRKFDEIVAFSEVERFIDTPVKRYSSGMYVRLAFAVAAHLEPEILVIDEVLAVGDQGFQSKCLGKMREVSGEGRTVLFVSHNMGAIAALCSRCLLLGEGRMISAGSTETVIDDYLDQSVGLSVAERLNRETGKGLAWFLDVAVEADGISGGEAVPVTSPFWVRLDVECREMLQGVEVGIRFERAGGQAVFTTGAAQAEGTFALQRGVTKLSVTIPSHFLAPGTYELSIAIHRPNVEILALHDRLLRLHVIETGSEMWRYSGNDFGCVLVHFPWQIQGPGSSPLIGRPETLGQRGERRDTVAMGSERGSERSQ